MGDIAPGTGLQLLIAWNAIQNRHAAQAHYEAHLRTIAYDALSTIQHQSEQWDLDAIADEILVSLGLSVRV
jgi:tRNA U34 5-methylaminomethyl-2-thiouridine-forming methyltransferase MnmC